MKEIEKLYDLYSKDVYRFIYSLSFDEEIAKDIFINEGAYKTLSREDLVQILKESM